MVDRRAQLWALVLGRSAQPGRLLWSVCEVARDQVGVDGAAVSLGGGGRNQELAASVGELAVALEELQYTVGEGPAVEAFRTGAPVLVADVAEEDGRWPGFTAMASEAGLAAVFAFPLRVGAMRLGTLALYRGLPERLSTAQLADAGVLAQFAAAALVGDQGQAVTQAALFQGHYDQVHLATGILAAQLGISVSDASARLRSHAFSQGISLREVADAIVGQRLRLDESSE